MDNFIEMRADQLYDVDGGLFTLAAGAVALAAGFSIGYGLARVFV